VRFELYSCHGAHDSPSRNRMEKIHAPAPPGAHKAWPMNAHCEERRGALACLSNILSCGDNRVRSIRTHIATSRSLLDTFSSALRAALSFDPAALSPCKIKKIAAASFHVWQTPCTVVAGQEEPRFSIWCDQLLQSVRARHSHLVDDCDQASPCRRL
jgi:hypothetical protein